MLQDHIHSNSMAIVLIGDFNPLLFQPLWLSEKKLIREGEAIEAKIDAISPNITLFKLDWVDFNITPTRLEMKVAKEPFFEPARDLLLGIFKYLKETPIRILGINYLKNLSIPDKDMYYEIGNKLAPLNLWSDFINDPRLSIVEILEKSREDKLPGSYRVKIFPTPSNYNIQYGITINITDQYDLNEGANGRNGEILNILTEQWEISGKRAKRVIDSLLTKLN